MTWNTACRPATVEDYAFTGAKAVDGEVSTIDLRMCAKYAQANSKESSATPVMHGRPG